MTPASENIRGTSALPYHILAGRDEEVEIELYSFNLNNLPDAKVSSVAQELDIKIHILPVPWWYTFLLKFFLFFRIFLKVPVGNHLRLNADQKDTIIRKNPDGIWIYGEELSNVSRQLDVFKRVHTLPDCESLYYYRMLGKRFAMQDRKRYWRSVFMYPKFLNMERCFDTSSNIHYHLVGEADVRFLKEIIPGIQAHFLRHPHYQLADPPKDIAFSSKIKLLIAGQYNLYMQQDADELINCLCSSRCTEDLKEHYVITFLGKGWEIHVRHLEEAGYEVHHIRFAPNYIEEIIKHDIQITPISIGTGTKGKVLDAIANGLLVIGSWYALENIAVEHDVSCLQYRTVDEVISMLRKIYLCPSHYEEIAQSGRKSVLCFHDGELTAQQMFSLLQA